MYNIIIYTALLLTLDQVTQVTGTATAIGAASGTKGANAGQVTGSGSSTGSGTVPSGAGSSSTANSGSVESSGSSSKSSLPQAAIIAIAVLATIVAMLALFIYWNFIRKRKERQAQSARVPSNQPMNTTQNFPRNDAPYATPAVFKSPDSRVEELSGNPASGPIYETGTGQHIELDASSRRAF
jgi:hypothetical protein